MSRLKEQGNIMGLCPIFVCKRWCRTAVYLGSCLLIMSLPVYVGAQSSPEVAEQATEQATEQVTGQVAGQVEEQSSTEITDPLQGQGSLQPPELPALNSFGTEIAVNGQSTDEQLSAYRVAMRIILLQNSGEKSLLNDPEIQQALLEAESYIDDSRYRIPSGDDRITRATPLTPKVRRSNEATHLLRIQFNEELITGLITDQATPDPEPDPDAEPDLPTSALVWLVVDDGNAEHRIGGPTGANVVERLREIAGGVGQRLVFPQQDALDLQALTAADMKSGSVQRVQAASQRYKEDVVLVGVLIRDQSRSWVANWSRYYAGSVEDFNDTASNLDEALQQGTRWLASLAQSVDDESQQQGSNISSLGDQNSSFGREADTDTSLIWVSSLQSVEGYARLMQMIEELESVEVVFPSEVLPSGVLFSVSPRFALNDVTSRLAGVPWLRASLPGQSTFDQGSAVGQGQLPFGRPDVTYEFLR